MKTINDIISEGRRKGPEEMDWEVKGDTWDGTHLDMIVNGLRLGYKYAPDSDFKKWYKEALDHLKKCAPEWVEAKDKETNHYMKQGGASKEEIQAEINKYWDISTTKCASVNL